MSIQTTASEKQQPATSRGFKVMRLLVGLSIVLALAYYGYNQLSKPPETAVTRAVALIRQGKAAAALEILEKLSRQEPDNADVFPWLAAGYLATDRYAEGRTALDTALRLKLKLETLSPVVESYADYYERRGDYEEAEKLFRSAMRVCPEHFFDVRRAKLYLAWAESDMERSELLAAVDHLQLADSLSAELDDTTKARIPHWLADCYRRLAAIAETRDKNDQEAIRLLEKSLSVAEQPLTRVALASIYGRIGKREKAIENYEFVIETDPNNLEVRHYLIAHLLEKKDFVKAQQALSELLDKEKSVENYELLAAVNMELGNYAGAVRALEEASVLRPTVPLLEKLRASLTAWSEVLISQRKNQAAISVKGHAERISEQIAKLTGNLESGKDSDLAQGKAWDPGKPPIAIVFSRNWLVKGSLTPEGKIKIRNISGESVTDLTLTAVFFDNTTRKSDGSVQLPVASPSSPPFPPDDERWLYFSCPHTVKSEHQLAVCILWKGKFLKEFPVAKRR